MEGVGIGAIVAAIVTAVGTGLAALVTKKPGVDNADAAERLVKASVSFTEQVQRDLAMWRTEATDCKAALINLQDELRQLRAEYDQLHDYLKSVGLEPPKE